ncbi:hypothetical protein DIS24_g406 [Lasiodiplodia hormozganensis]|uniref:Uncharacterized protein n=1 Tax=Lasiodiplodia hormozganensis TaxID=869390 RepID=A0AA39Z6K2_9PEZI|nr:hypothetical protein DIS24_g406 [Lasiodiplodia hormozganensis]
MQSTARKMFKLGMTKTRPSPAESAPAPVSKVNTRDMAAAPIHDEPTFTKSAKTNPPKGRLSSKLKSISSTATKAIKCASQKVSRILSTSKSEGFPSRVRPHRKLTPYPGPAVCDSSESSQQDIHRSAYQEAENDSCRDTESSYSLDSSSNYPSFNLMTHGPLPAHDPGHIPSPYEHTGTSMEVCEWASSPAISTDIYAIRKAAAEGDQTDDSLRRASCLNRADQHLYHVPGSLNIRLLNGATGQMRLSPEYPRGAKGLKRPDDSDFPSWHRDTDGFMVPTPRLLQGVFLPEPSHLREVETVQSGEDFRSLGQNVTLHSFRRKSSPVSRQCGSSTGLVRPTLQAASVAEEEETFTDSPEDASLFSTFDGSYDVCDTDSQVVSNEQTIQDVGFRRLPLTHARNPITRSTGHLNLRSISRGIIIEEEEEDGLSASEGPIKKESKEDTPDEETGGVQLYENGFSEADSEPTAGADSEFAIPEMHEGSGLPPPEFDSDSYDWESAIIEQAQLCSIQQVKAKLISQPRPPNPHN